jgi:hypothetical protein
VSSTSAPGPALAPVLLPGFFPPPPHWRTKQRDPHLLAPRWSSHRQYRGRRRSPMTHLVGLSAPGHVAVLIITPHPWGSVTTGRCSRGSSAFYSRSPGGVAAFPARRRMRGFEEGGRHLSGGYRCCVAKEFPRAHSLIEPARACRRHAGGPPGGPLRRHRGWRRRRRRRRPALGIIGGVVPQHRPENPGQPAGQRDRRHRPAAPRRDPQGPGP